MTGDDAERTGEPHESSFAASRRTALQLLSGAAAASATGSVAAFDALVETEFDTERTHGEWILRLSDPLAVAPDGHASVSAARTATFESQEPTLSALDGLSDVTVTNRFWAANAVLVEVTDVDVETLRAVEGVQTVHPNFAVEAPDPVDSERLSALEAERTYGLAQIDAPAVWEAYDSRGEGVRVAVLDTGAHEPHADITVDGWAEFDEEGDPVDSDPHDPSGHGTHVAGTAVGRNEGPIDIGVAPDAEHYHAKVFPGSDRTTTFAAIIAGMEWAADEDADVMNMSLGATGFFPSFIEPVQTVQSLGTLVVASSGNEGVDTSGSPGNVHESTAVGATDEAEAVPSFSSGQQVYTPGDWGFFAPPEYPTWYVVPDVATPGVSVRSAATDTDGGYELRSGTSMAAPHATGLLALALSVDPELDVESMQELLDASAVHPDGEPSPEPRYGSGIPSALNAAVDRAEDGLLSGSVALDGESATGASVQSDVGTRDVVDTAGEYELPVSEGLRTVTATAFGFETETSIDVEGETALDLTLEAVLDVNLRQGQPPDAADGDTIQLVLDVAHVEAVTVDLAEELGQRLALDTADLLGGLGEDVLFQVDLHPTDEEGMLVPDEFVGATPVLGGENDDTELTLVDGDGEETTLDPDETYVAMIHLVDPDAVEDDPAAGDFYLPGTFPVLQRATADGLVETGVTDSATVEGTDSTGTAVEGTDSAGTAVEQSTLEFREQAVDTDGDSPHAVAEGVTGEDTVAVVVTYPNGDDDIVAGLETEFAPDGEEIPVELESTDGFPGTHTAHVLPAEDLSGEYDPGDVLSAETVGAVQDQASARVYAASLSLPDQSVDPTVDVAVAGEAVDPGETLEFDDPVTEEGVALEVTVAGAPDGSEVALEHTFEGLDEVVTRSTGPTTVKQDPDPALFEIADTDFDDTVGDDGLLESSVVVENTGELTADESVFFFVGDIVTEGGTPVQQLFEFPLALGPGESALLPLGPISFGAFPRQEGTQLVLTVDPEVPDDSAEGGFLIEGPLYDLLDVDAPSEIDTGQPFEAAVTLTNTGEMEGNAQFAVEFADRTVADVAEPVEPGDTVTVDVTVETDGLPAGTYGYLVAPEPPIRYDDPTPVDGTVDLVEPDGPPPLPGFSDPPRDLNGDGLFEDIDGDGEFTIFDVQAFFDSFDSDVVQNNAEFFDFNDDGDVTIFDVQALFQRLQGWDD